VNRREQRPLRVINSVAPIRICDNGGWTDTWFAGHGKIFNIGVYPYVEVQIEVYPYEPGEDRIVLYAENYGERFVVNPDVPGWDHHPLLEASIERVGVPENLAIQATIYSEAPSGCSTGTSAAVTVALIGALDKLTPGQRSPHEVAFTAHSVESDMLKQQSGIQDQLCVGVWWHQLHRDAPLSARFSVADPGRQPHLVGSGAPPGTDLPGQDA